MGQAVKQLAVVAAVAAVTVGTGGAGGFFATTFGVGATTAGVLAAVAGAVVGVIAGKVLGVGKINQDEIEPVETYATTTLRNQTNNNNVVPVIYGENRSGGNRVFADLQTGGNNNLYEIVVFANHEIEDFVDVFANNVSMTQGTGGDTDKYRFANDKILVKVYKVKSTPIKAITSYSGGTWTETNLSSLTFQNGSFSDSDIPDGTCFAVIHNIYNSTDNNQRREITARIQGKLIRPLSDSSTIGSTPVYSNNPAEIVLDYLTDSKKFNEEDSKIDIESFYNSKLLCDSYGFTCNILFGAKSNNSAEMQEILATFRGQIIYSQGVWKLKQDEANRTATFNITGDDIISGSFSWSQKKAKDIANTTQVIYIEPSDQWQTKFSTQYQDTDLVTSDGREYRREIKLRGVTNSTQADKIAELSLNQFRYTEDADGNRIKVTPLLIKFKTTIKNAELEVGDMGTIDYYELPSSKKFVIIAIATKQSGELDITATEYADTHYKDSGGSPIIS